VPPGVTLPAPDATARPTGIGAWLSPEGTMRRLNLEFRVHVRPSGHPPVLVDGRSRRAPGMGSIRSTFAFPPSVPRVKARCIPFATRAGAIRSSSIRLFSRTLITSPMGGSTSADTTLQAMEANISNCPIGHRMNPLK
jgi:hypothetical protein